MLIFLFRIKTNPTEAHTAGTNESGEADIIFSVAAAIFGVMRLESKFSKSSFIEGYNSKCDLMTTHFVHKPGPKRPSWSSKLNHFGP